MNFKSKLPTVRTTIFTIMSSLAKEHNAINLSQGFPDFESDPLLIELVSQAMKNGYNQYAPMKGIIELREAIARKFKNIYQSSYHPVQVALAKYLEQPKHYNLLPEFYQKKRDLFLAAIANSNFSFKPTQATYFQTLKYSTISNEGDVDFAKRLTLEAGIASIPMSVFNKNQQDNKTLRFCFAKTDETLFKAAEILNKL